jgi:hypothetical protein
MSAVTPDTGAGALRTALAFEAVGETAGNVTLGRGRFSGRAVRVGLIENRFASGAIGALEAERLAALLRIVAIERVPLVLYLDSAGAKVSEGLKALGAFRLLFHAGLDAALSGVPIAVVLGRNCYGGSSMLAHLAARRLFTAGTRLAMSGPSILASAAGMNVLDEAFRAMAEAAMSSGARARASQANTVLERADELSSWLAEALAAPGDAAAAFHQRHEALAHRLERPLPAARWEALERRDLAKIYPDGYAAREAQGFIEGTGRRNGAEEAFLGIVGAAALGIERAWRFAEAAWQHARAAPAHLEVFLDCATHAARLEDEKAVLSEFIVDMSAALAVAARRTTVGLTILGRAGGGVYVALAAPARRVTSVYGADIQVLPGSAVAAILGESHDAIPTFHDYREARVADEEIRLGLTASP